ncbi:MAG: hypothetical protein CMI56_03025 [Parcubacteria group bacterium]|nr:hypothetical protein [Parcubacteria group bacterium]|tara:strand:- start:338 stop:580 length:243 start_codon:yes stop_codon:yes gene_type:complete
MEKIFPMKIGINMMCQFVDVKHVRVLARLNLHAAVHLVVPSIKLFNRKIFNATATFLMYFKMQKVRKKAIPRTTFSRLLT